MNFTGIAPEDVYASMNGVRSAYEQLINVLSSDMQSKFIQGMAQTWACKNAQDFFNLVFKPAVDDLISGTSQTYGTVVNAMNTSALEWGSQTGYDYQSSPFEPISREVDTSVIREEVGGVRGVDLVAANTVADSLNTILSSAESALTSARNAVESSGFVGGDQQANLVNSLETIKSRIGEVVGDITSQTKTVINQTVEEYADTAGRISQAFTIQG